MRGCDSMTLTEQARAETVCAATARHGGAGKPFWNAEARQFKFVPAFQFAPVPGCERYLYEATDENGKIHSFVADSASALLTPIWGEIPEGVVTLTVYATAENGQKQHLIGARTFFRSAPFSEDCPPAEGSYRECALRAFDYCFRNPMLKHWLDFGTPDPHYDLNVYPSKMIAAVITSMLRYGEICPEKSGDCLKIARNAADYLLKITEPAGTPLAGLPPTYYTDFRVFDSTMDNLTADERKHTIMMFYPACAGSAYLALEQKTGDKKYLNAALAIGQYYRENVLENGSWYLVVSRETGKPTARNCCMPTNAILPFLKSLFERTGEEYWQILADNALAYVENGPLKTYDWEGQFEDSVLSNNYSNLAHGDCDQLIMYYAANYPRDAEKIGVARELMCYVEDQFTVWHRPCPWDKWGFDPTCWPTPCGLEQYNWYVPVDASTAGIARAFFYLGKATGEALYFAKARALMNTVTRAQNKQSGIIPTEWLTPDFREIADCGREIWLNCILYTADILTEFADYFEI